ncbi:MAG: rhomboid family intramembrane serine protease [Candidatus Korarchaeum sp.]|nr:rhomboid family intramembrane serine protease [Candidatus Korarchaeum sp.]MDW8035661.1 rhomboid family intramembrane serine protease [Candidatus Korarchaeum sp.]
MALGIPMTLPEFRPKHRVTISLIIANSLIYAATSYRNFFVSVSDYWVTAGGFSPSLLSYPDQWYRLLTSMFLHADIFHIFFNMYFLFFAGRAVEDALGSLRFALLYFLSGLAASVFHSAYSFIGGLTSYAVPAIGASGAISGVLGAYLMFYPGTSLVICIPIFLIPFCFPMRASLYIVFWFAMQVIYGYARIAGSVAVFAHAGGFLAGVALLYFLANKRRISLLRIITHATRVPFLMLPSAYPKGLSSLSKTVLSVLTVMLIVGGAYTVIVAPTVGNITVATVQYTLNGIPYVDYAAFKPPDFESYRGTMALQETRILLNRLAAAKLLYDTGKSMKTVEIKNMQVKTEHIITLGNKAQKVSVDNLVEYFKGTYDPSGLLVKAEGGVVTRVIYITGLSYSLSDPVRYEFSISSINVDVGVISRYTGLVSLMIAAAAQLTFTKKDQELSIVAEE